MNPKMRNWLIAAAVIVVFILGMPLVQRVFAGSDNATEAVTTPKAEPAHPPTAHTPMGHPQVIKVGDQYLRIASNGDDSICAMLYDANFRLLAVNETETALNFTLPNGEKKSLNITAPTTGSGCTVGQEGSVMKDDCCPPQSAEMPAECPHMKTAEQE
jgi:hypothetical protein